MKVKKNEKVNKVTNTENKSKNKLEEVIMPNRKDKKDLGRVWRIF